jgi:hypothetical protein
MALGGFIWGTGCLKRKVNAPVPVAASPAENAAAVDPGGSRVPRLQTAAPWPAATSADFAPVPAQDEQAVAPVLRGEPLHGLPEPLGNRKAGGHEPLWRARARNY